MGRPLGNFSSRNIVLNGMEVSCPRGPEWSGPRPLERVVTPAQ